jgi:hypothetical protein
MPKSRKRRKATDVVVVPPYTASLDARVPAENVVLSHYIAECAKWYVASRSYDGRIFTAFSATEPNARRAAGLRTLAHLKSRAEGNLKELTPEEIAHARNELAGELKQLIVTVIGFNGEFPDTYPVDVVLAELRCASELVATPAERSILARWVAPPLLFLGGAFSEGIIGVYAEKAMNALTKILSG